MTQRPRDYLLTAIEALDHYMAVAIIALRDIAHHIRAARAERIEAQRRTAALRRRKAEYERIHYIALGVHLQNTSRTRNIHQ